MSLTGENSPKDLLELNKISTGNVEKIVKIVRVHLTDKNKASYLRKYKPNGNRSERKKGEKKTLMQISKKSLPENMENDETTDENYDYDFVAIGGAEQSLSHEKTS